MESLFVIKDLSRPFAPLRRTTPPSGVSVRIDNGLTCFNCGAIHFRQASEKTDSFECVSIWVKGGWKETLGLQRPISAETPASESRMASLNPFETKRKKAPSGTSSQVCDVQVAERLAKLAGGVAVIKVGGATEIEVKERKDRVDDALNATRAAVQEGVVPGGGVALVHAGKVLRGLKGDNADQAAGIAIIRKALQAPLSQIAENAGVDGSVVAGKIVENSSKTFGYDAQSAQYSDMLKAGVIDPTKVVRIALEYAASVAGLLITTEAMVADKPTKAGGNSMPDMGGMGGMI